MGTEPNKHTRKLDHRDRKLALWLFHHGIRVADIAAYFDVTPGSIRYWLGPIKPEGGIPKLVRHYYDEAA